MRLYKFLTKFVGKGISFAYPDDWTLQESQVSSSEAERFGTSTDTERFTIINNDLKSRIAISFSPTDLQDYGLSENSTQENIESSLEQIFPEYMLNSFLSGIDKGVLTEVEKPDYNKYLIDGYKTGSAAFTAVYGEIPLKTVLVGTLIGNNSLAISYSAPAPVFDQIVPIAENVIKSIRIQ
jgi:hypothetical protein